ncbi:MAG: type IV pilus secretin PilQ [Deltaproteobacteria bacterium]|nr:type IV pilus secretin PilQ [Deltaproteobacteria bacterium]
MSFIKKLMSVQRSVFLMTLFAILIVSGCAQQQAQKPQLEAELDQAKVEATIEDEVAKEESSRLVVSSVNVIAEGEAILIEANGPMQYTAFRLEDPPRLVVDIPGADISGMESPVVVQNDFIDSVSTSVYGEGDKQIARVEVTLQEGIEYDTMSGEDSILIELIRDVYISGVSAPVEEVTIEDFDEAELIVFEEEEEEVIPEDVAPVDEFMEEATAIIDLEASERPGGEVVSIVANGAIGNYNSFSLESPPRVVVDIWDVNSELGKKVVAVDGKNLNNVRVGVHSDKVRFVFDMLGSEVPQFTVRKKGAKINLAFGSVVEPSEIETVSEFEEEAAIVDISKDEEALVDEMFDEEAMIDDMADDELFEDKSSVVVVDEDSDVMEEELFEAVEGASKEVAIKDVRFVKISSELARLSVIASGKPVYEITESLDGGTITLDIASAVIPEKLKLTLDARDLKTPVSTISSFQSAIAPVSIVRVLVKLKEGVFYNVVESMNSVSIDFPIDGGFVSDRKASFEGAGAGDILAEVDSEEVDIDEETKYTGDPITLEMVDAKVLDVLDMLALVSGLNIVALPEEVSGTITLRLVEVPWDQAFDIILNAKNLDKVQKGNVVRVAPKSKLQAERNAKLQEERSKEQLEDLHTEYIRINYDKAADLQSQVSNLLSDRGTISVHENTNTLIVKDIRSVIEEIQVFIGKLDIPTPQVLIEARIVQADSSFTRDLGVQWGLEGGVVSNGVALRSEGGLAATGGGISTEHYVVDQPANNMLGAIGFAFGKTGANPLLLDLKISAGEQNGIVKTISRPRIITMDNKSATIQQGESIPIAISSASGSSTSFIDANLKLEVTPQITPDGSVLMEISASKNSIGAHSAADGTPSIDKKEATTTVLVKDGETTVIGGIIISDTSTSEGGVPFFKDIPGLGWFFKNKSVSDTQKELLIFITPTIIREGTTDDVTDELN